MATDPNRRAAELFRAALERTPEERAAFVRAQCGNDQRLLEDVESLLQADLAAGNFLDPSAVRGAAASVEKGAAQHMVDRRVGRYHLRRLIAEGGMGAVYEASQDVPRRVVALKMMKRGLASRSALRRFEYESQILARLRHPGIAQVFDAGVYDDGQGGVPYFVMEYVPTARQITDYANDKNLGTRDRLELFVQVCDAVNHGHQRAILHRDLKPANILVDSAGLIKVIDFGVARATDSDLVLTTLQTDVGQLLGTVQYMSPEQVRNDPQDLDVRTDVYSLGMVLYELVCGRLPYDVGNVHLLEATRLICEQPPQRPSTLSRSLRGDLETIVLKALEKNRERRYQSAADLGADIRRFLASQTIAARPPSVAYQLRAFARRNKALVGGVAATILVLVVSVIVVSILAVRIQRESSRRAEINAFLESMLMAADASRFDFGPDQPRRFGANSRWGDVIDDAVKRLDEHPLTDREAEARIRHRVGHVYLWMFKLDSAYENLKKAYTARRELLGDDDPSTLESQVGIAWCKTFLFDSYEAERLALRATEAFERQFGSADVRTLNAMQALAVSRTYISDWDAVAATAQQMIDILEAHPEIHYPRDGSKALLARSLLRFPGRWDEAEALAREAISDAQRGNANSLTHCHANIVLGEIFEFRGDLESAEAHYRTGLEIWESRTGPRNLELQSVLARVLCMQDGKRQAGLSMLHAIMKAAREEYGDDHPFTEYVVFLASNGFADAGQLDDAEGALRDCIRILETAQHTTIPRHMNTLWKLGDILRRQGKLDEAEAVLRKGIAIAARISADQWRKCDWWGPEAIWTQLGLLYDQRGRRDEADHCFDRARAGLDAKFDTEFATYFLWNIEEVGRSSQGEAVARALVERHRHDKNFSRQQLADSLLKLGIVVESLDRLEEAEKAYRESIETQGTAIGGSEDPMLDAMTRLAFLLLRRGNASEAEGLLRSVLDARRRLDGEGQPQSLMAMTRLARLLEKAGRPADAEPIARAAVEGWRRLEAKDAGDVIEALTSCAVLLRDLGRLDEAEGVFRDVVVRSRKLHSDRTPLDSGLALEFGECLLAMKRFEEAEPLLVASHAAFDGDSHERESLDRSESLLVRLYEEWGKPDLAKGYRRSTHQ